MHKVIACSLLFVTSSTAAAGRTPGESHAIQGRGGETIERLAWLSGCWTQSRANGVIEEHWMTPRGGSMLGMSRTVVKGATAEYEFLRIAVVDGTLSYVAMPSEQPQAAFPVKSMEDGVVVFENLAHDFPQRIIYRKQSNGVTARIEGVVKGEARGQDFPYHRCQT